MCIRDSVDPSYVLTCTTVHSEGGSPHGEKYGYNWWITENNGYHAFFAGGYGGQFIYVIPDLDLVVAITCNTSEHREDARFLINSHVVPAIQNSSVARSSIHKEGSGLIVYPNPSTGEMNIGIETAGHEPVSLYITDLTGRKCYTIIDKNTLSPGSHTYILSVGLPSGCYLIKGKAGAREYNKKLILSD